jgi:hypothetical protein
VFRLSAGLFLLLAVAACASAPPRPSLNDLPVLALTPASLGRELALQQRLEVTVAGRSQVLDALLEVDADELRLAVQMLGQSALTLSWDGKQLQQQRADWLPPTLDGARVLFDLQLVYWPAQEIRAALPEDWQLLEQGSTRQLMHAGQTALTIEYLDAGHVRLTQPKEAYVLDIQSVSMTGEAR